MSPLEVVRRQRRKEARPAELAAAALSLFIEKGFAATRLDEVAARAGVSKGTLYLYFDSKDALFKAVIEEGVVPLFEEFEAKLETLRDDPERLLREILQFLRGVDRRSQVEEFSLARLIGAVVQLMAVGALIWAVFGSIWGNVTDQIIRLMYALILQLIALTLLVVPSRK